MRAIIRPLIQKGGADSCNNCTLTTNGVHFFEEKSPKISSKEKLNYNITKKGNLVRRLAIVPKD